MNLTRTITPAAAILSFHLAFAQPPKYSNEFLSIGVGGRALGMSNSVVATADDATSAFWNPAGLTKINGNLQVAAMHAELFASILKFDYVTVATKVHENRALAFSIVRLGTDDIPNTLDIVDASNNIDYSKLKSFASADYAFYFSYAVKPKMEGLRYGGSVKVVHRIVGE